MTGSRAVRNLIIDLGGVVVDLDVERSLRALQRLWNGDAAAPDLLLESPVFHQFERGELSPTAFRGRLREILQSRMTDGELDAAWNAMILGVPREKLEWLERLQARGYRMFLLSNTNDIHLPFVENLLYAVSGAQTFDPWFDRCYYSHRLGMRKPDVQIYQAVLEENSLDASETLMIDDNPLNLAGAARAGLQTYLAESRHHVLQFD
jgi:putative hydrolase of the HAD superfamily